MDKEWEQVPSLKYYEATRDGRLRTYWVKMYIAAEGRKNRKIEWLVSEIATEVIPIERLKGTSVSVWVKRGRCFSRRPLGSIILETFSRPRVVEVSINLNGNRSDNRIENLKWGTLEEAHAIALASGRRTNAKLTFEKVDEIRKCVERGESQKSLASKFGVSRSVVSNIINGKSWIRRGV